MSVGVAKILFLGSYAFLTEVMSMEGHGISWWEALFLGYVLYAWYVLRYAHAHVIYLLVAGEMGSHT